MDDSQITRPEYEEYKKREAEAHERIDKRLAILEKSGEQIGKLCISIEKLATNMEHMAAEQKEQGVKLEKLEQRDGDRWRQVVGYVVTAVVGILIGFVFKQFGIF